MFSTTGYVVLDVFLEPIRSYTVNQLAMAEMFVYNRPDCIIEPITLNLYDTLGECLL